MVAEALPFETPSFEDRLEAVARAHGFVAFGIARADAAPQTAARLNQWLAEGRHGDMIWMESRAAQRGSPKGLWPEVQSVIALGMSYAPAHDPLVLADHPERGRISVYAQGGDYHDVVKKALKAVARWLVAEVKDAEVKVFVDTAPVMEKPLSAAAGLGWQGKHTNLVSREFGSWLFLGSLFTTADLAFDEAERDHCGSCRACLDACPTDAFPAPYRIDARRCISYLTIEHKGPIDPEFRPLIGNRIYGCDDCLAACPWNKFAQAASEMKLRARDDLKAPSLETLLDLDDPSFRSLFSGSPVKRIGRDRFVRNVLIAAGNSGSQALVPAVKARVNDTSAVVRAMAVWALSRLVAPAALAEFAEQCEPETDEDVLNEWQIAGVSRCMS
ncbi:MAG: tRNA epoxyqueuosine(34) reductase QueG [Ensifer adhaerens]